ncbi:MAG: quinol:cytochrome C oxidoreductase [Flavobacteriaceae bacterium]|nr:quinol:cytochrome C oxidoreductase [Flavobacteriaceae bacterium]|tara:strand:+ start:12436 stop:15558 length:3123 start_codon:yes stop_codon:yes gene_type:complete
MSSNKKYWKNVEEISPGQSAALTSLKHKEFVQEIPVDEFLGDKIALESSKTTRRDFLKYIGFSTAAASLAACEGPVIKSIPYVVQPEQIIPGVANYYATSIGNGYDFASLLIKTREGRPIKIECNTLAGENGTTNARVQASVLDLYDNQRLSGPLKDGENISWKDFYKEVGEKLEMVESQNKAIVLLTQTYASPSTSKLISEFKAKYKNASHIVYDAISESFAADAYEARYGRRGLANYDFSKAKTIVSIGADFLGDWQGGGFDSTYAKGRVPKNGTMSRHIQFESNMSLSGANADKRVTLKPSQQKLALVRLYGKITGSFVSVNLPPRIEAAIDSAATEISKAGPNAVVLTGIQDEKAQGLVIAINEFINSKAFDPKTIILTRQGNDKAVSAVVKDMNAGHVGAVIMAGVNPVYTLPNAAAFVEGLKKTALSVVFTMKNDETAAKTQYVGAAPHYLESWGDFETKSGFYALMQPTIRPLFDTQQFQEALLFLNGATTNYHDYIKSFWENNVLVDCTWNKALHDGVFNGSSLETIKTSDKLTNTVFDLSDTILNLSNTKSSDFELTLYPKTGMGDGQQANNPWLQEFPDPLTRTTWDNYLTVSEYDAKNLGLYLDPSNFFNQSSHDATGGLNGTYANVTVGGITIKAPVIIQPGQARGTVGLSFGYGRTNGLKAEMQTGVNAYPLYKDFSATQAVAITAAGGKHEFASVQLHNTLMGRGDIIKETTLEVFNTKDSEYWNPTPVVSLNHVETPVSSPDVDLWDEFDRSIGHHFNLSIDLNSCTGCGACVIACHAENNVPVVGKEEIRRSRDMHWLRIDRYYSSDETFEGDNKTKDDISGLASSLSTFGEMEFPSENPQVAFQPIMCQHCNHAPCETVCPVAASAHGRQGQNHMTYNRCVGTRYCANNCPYKVRRFNWFLYNGNDEFDYHMNNDLGRMVINPDVTVRSRGVMEKCSFCIQTTQAVILKAKRESRPVAAGEFNDACACSAACSSGAMRFGDINEKDSPISKLVKDDRAYHLLEHVGTKPNVVYQVKVRNNNKA